MSQDLAVLHDESIRGKLILIHFINGLYCPKNGSMIAHGQIWIVKELNPVTGEKNDRSFFYLF